MKKCIIVTLFIVTLTSMYAQHNRDSIIRRPNYELSGCLSYLYVDRNKQIVIAPQYEFLKSMSGLKLSNGFDERPLFHFEDLSDDLVFKFQGYSDFNNNYSYGISLGWSYLKYFSLISMEYLKYDYHKCGIQFQKINLSAECYIKNTKFVLILKPGLHKLNGYENLGVDIGIRRVLIYRKLYFIASTGYYSDYFTYHGVLKGFIYKNKISLSAEYNKIDKYDFLNMGISFIFNR